MRKDIPLRSGRYVRLFHTEHGYIRLSTENTVICKCRDFQWHLSSSHKNVWQIESTVHESGEISWNEPCRFRLIGTKYYLYRSPLDDSGDDTDVSERGGVTLNHTDHHCIRRSQQRSMSMAYVIQRRWNWQHHMSEQICLHTFWRGERILLNVIEGMQSENGRSRWLQCGTNISNNDNREELIGVISRW